MKTKKTVHNIGLNFTLADIRNPLTKILLAVEELRDPGVTGEAKQCLLDIIAKSTENIEKNIKEMCEMLDENQLTM